MNKVLFNNNIDSYNYKPIPNTKINIIASDGNYQYHKIIKCKERKIVKVYKDKKTKRLLRDKEGNIIKDIKKEYYNITKNEEIYLDCNKHIIDKAETSLVEFINGCLRDTFARYNRGTKAFSRAIKAIEDSIVIFVNRHLWDRNIRKYANLGRIGYEKGITLLINNGRCNIEVINQNIRTTLEDIKKDITEMRKDIKDIKDGIGVLIKEVKDKGRSKNKKGGKKVA